MLLLIPSLQISLSRLGFTSTVATAMVLRTY